MLVRLVRCAADGLAEPSRVAVDALRACSGWLDEFCERRNSQTGLLHQDELVDEALVESFPASDPPAWWAGPPAAEWPSRQR